MVVYGFTVQLEDVDGDTLSEYSRDMSEQIADWYTSFVRQIAGEELVGVTFDGSYFEIELKNPCDEYTLDLLINPDPEWNYPVDFRWRTYGIPVY
jgi:hypothetical protein